MKAVFLEIHQGNVDKSAVFRDMERWEAL